MLASVLRFTTWRKCDSEARFRSCLCVEAVATSARHAKLVSFAFRSDIVFELQTMKPIVFASFVLCSMLYAAPESELKDDTGKTIVRYVIEVPPGVAEKSTKDPARDVGLFLCFQEHDTPTGNDLFPVRQTLLRQGALGNYILLAAAPQGRKFGPADHEPIEKLLAWALKTYRSTHAGCTCSVKERAPKYRWSSR